MRTDERGSEILDQDDCLQLLSACEGAVGRVGFVDAQGLPTILPVNFALMGGDLVFRTGTGAAAGAVAENQVVAFEFDEVDVRTGRCWSVLVRGLASFFSDDSVASGPELPTAYVPVPGSQIVRVATTSVTGRRFFLPALDGLSFSGVT